MTTAPFDLAIVGAGPVGVTAALLAGRLGLRTIVLDREVAPYDKPRAMGFDHDVMRVFQELGLGPALAESIAPYRPSLYRGIGGHVIKHVDSAPEPYPLGHPPNVTFLQPALEALLRAQAATLPTVTMALGTEVTGVTGIDGALATVATKTGAYEARYVLACDGGASPIRTALGLELESLDFDQPWLVVDARVDEAHLGALPQTNVQVCDAARPTTFVVGPQNIRRWEFMMLPDDPPDITTDEGIHRLLSAWLPREQYTLWRASAYRFHALVLHDWRRGNLFFAGDAAHMTPPFLAQGMCQGIRDAQNFVWKLALALGGKADADILNSYATERRPHVRATTEIAKTFGTLICELSAERAAARDARLRSEGEPRIELRQDLIPPLAGGLLDARPEAADGARGRVLPQPWVRDGAGRVLLDTVTGSGFVLVHREPVCAEDLSEGARDVLAALSVRSLRLGHDIVEEHGVLAAFLDRFGHQAVLVRPDHYVFGGAADTGETGELVLELARQLQSVKERA